MAPSTGARADSANSPFRLLLESGRHRGWAPHTHPPVAPLSARFAPSDFRPGARSRRRGAICAIGPRAHGDCRMSGLRITGGILSGRRIEWSEAPGTHPMGERQRLAIFNMLGGIDVLRGAGRGVLRGADKARGVSVLDLYAGSGALGIEALSRGAERCVFVERSRRCAVQIEAALEKLGLSGKAKVVVKTVESVLKTVDDKFDLIFCDPPYDKMNDRIFESVSNVLAEGGTLVLSHPEGFAVKFDDLELIKNRKYAGANVSIYGKWQGAK